MALIPKRILDGFLSQNNDQIYEVWEEVGVEMGLSKEQIELVIEDYFSRLRLAVEDPRLPKVYLDTFLVIKSPYYNIRKLLRRFIKQFKKKNSTFSYAKLINTIKLHWRNYKRTWEEYLGKRIDFAAEHYQDIDKFYAENVEYIKYDNTVKSERKIVREMELLARRKQLYNLPEEYPFSDDTVFKGSGYLNQHLKKGELFRKGINGELEEYDLSDGKKKRNRKKKK